MGYSIWRQVRADLRRILLTIPGVPDVQFEGRKFTPAAGVAWLQEAIEKGPSVTHTLGFHGLTEERGIYLLNLNWPANGVMADGEDLADKIRLAFWHGRGLGVTAPDFITGGVLRSEARRTVVTDAWTIFPVRIEFYVRRRTMQGVPAA